MKKLFLVLTLGFCLFSHAQSETYLKEVKSALENNGTVTYYDNVVDRLFTLLKENYKTQKL